VGGQVISFAKTSRLIHCRLFATVMLHPLKHQLDSFLLPG
jgi:hypothetical protein